MALTPETQQLMNLVRVLNDGIDFYRDAESKVHSTGLKRTFERMATTRQKLVNRLQPYIIAQQGERESGHTYGGRLRELYTSFLATIRSDVDQTYIDHLEELEDQTLHTLGDTLRAARNRELMAALKEFQQHLKRCREEMRQLKQRH